MENHTVNQEPGYSHYGPVDVSYFIDSLGVSNSIPRPRRCFVVTRGDYSEEQIKKAKSRGLKIIDNKYTESYNPYDVLFNWINSWKPRETDKDER